MKHALLCTALILSGTSPVAAGPPEKEILIGRPISLAVQPETVRLSGPRAMQQILVSGRYSDGSERDLTPFCGLSAESAGVITISSAGLLQPRKDGRTTLLVRAGTLTARVGVVVTDFDKPQPVSFRRE